MDNEESDLSIGSYIYTSVSKQLDDVIYEKKYLLADYVALYSLYIIVFRDNPNLEDALDEISDIFKDLLVEADYVQDIFEAIKEYLASLDDLDSFDDETVVDNFADIFENLVNIGAVRVSYYDACIDFFYDILSEGVLTNKNYSYLKYAKAMSKKERNAMLELIPGVK